MNAITPKHIERGQQIRRIVREDVLRGATFDDACANLAEELGISVDAVKLAIAIANEPELALGR